MLEQLSATQITAARLRQIAKELILQAEALEAQAIKETGHVRVPPRRRAMRPKDELRGKGGLR